MTGNANFAVVVVRFAQVETLGVFGQDPGVNAPVTMLAIAVKELLRTSYKPRRYSLGVTPRNCLNTRVM